MKDKKVQNFLKSCKEKDVLILYDSDLDGTCSAIITTKALKQNKSSVKTIASDRTRLQEYIDDNPDFKFIIILDQAPGQLKLTKNHKILAIDHHPSENMSSTKVVHINPLFKKRVYQPTSYLVYRIFSEFFDLKKSEWIAVLGTTSDYGYDDVKDLMDQHMSVDERDEIWETAYGNAAKIIGGAALDLGYEKIFQILYTTKDLDSSIAEPEIKRGYKEYTIEYLRCKKLAVQNMENIGPMLFTRLSSKYQGVASHISMDLMKEHPKKIIFVCERRDGNVKISGRSHKEGIDLGKIMKKATQGIGKGGGHPPAAGAMVPDAKFDVFKERVIKLVQG